MASFTSSVLLFTIAVLLVSFAVTHDVVVFRKGHSVGLRCLLVSHERRKEKRVPSPRPLGPYMYSILFRTTG